VGGRQKKKEFLTAKGMPVNGIVPQNKKKFGKGPSPTQRGGGTVEMEVEIYQMDHGGEPFSKGA